MLKILKTNGYKEWKNPKEKKDEKWRLDMPLEFLTGKKILHYLLEWINLYKLYDIVYTYHDYGFIEIFWSWAVIMLVIPYKFVIISKNVF